MRVRGPRPCRRARHGSRSGHRRNADATVPSTRCSRWPTATPRSAAGSSRAHSRTGCSSGSCRSRSSSSPVSESPPPGRATRRDAAARSLGLAGIVSGSVANAANSSARWYAFVIGIPILLWATRSLLRTLIVMHRLCWTDVRHAAPKATPKATLRVLGLFLCFFAVSAAASYVRSRSAGPGLIVTLVLLLPYGGIWLLVSLRLPHRDAPWTRSRSRARCSSPSGVEILNAVDRLLHRPGGGVQAGDVRLARARGGAAARAVLPEPARRRDGGAQCDAVGAAIALGADDRRLLRAAAAGRRRAARSRCRRTASRPRRRAS